MRLFAYSIFDVASGAYMRPFFLQSDSQAVRLFTDIATDKDHEIGKHPEDYTLFRVGEFDDNKGKMQGETPEALATALETIAASRIKPNRQAQLQILDKINDEEAKR